MSLGSQPAARSPPSDYTCDFGGQRDEKDHKTVLHIPYDNIKIQMVKILDGGELYERLTEHLFLHLCTSAFPDL